jgi:regulator of sigma E protease
MLSLFYLLITLAILIVVHEYGHFWVARRCGVKVLKFSVGFGRPLWSRIDKDGTEYSVSAIPLGGYVKMLDEREGNVNEEELSQAFNRKSLGKRSAIVAAGPIANLLFAVLAYWAIYMIGLPGQKPIIAEVQIDSAGYQAQLMAGDEIKAVNGQATPIWSSVRRELSGIATNGGEVELLVSIDGINRNLILNISKYDFEDPKQSLLKSLGIKPYIIKMRPVIESVTEEGAAKQAGLQAGDEVLSIDDKVITSWMDVVTIVQSKPSEALSFIVERNQQKQYLLITPSVSIDNKGKIGAMVDVSKTAIDKQYLATERYGIIGGLEKAIYQTWSFSAATLTSIAGMVLGDVSSKNIGGPVTIAQYAGSSAENGLISFVGFLAMISISLGLLNLMPIPVLDGGHLALYLIEWLRGKPLSENIQLQLQKIGIVALVLLMFLAFYNDLTRLFG